MTQSVTIYGASDDLIEVEGAIREEFDTDTNGDQILVVSGSGQVVNVMVFMDDDGHWQTSAKIINNPVMSLEGPSILIVDHARPGYTGEQGDMAVTISLDAKYGFVGVWKLAG